jgi:ClpX C4-type zinc finger
MADDRAGGGPEQTSIDTAHLQCSFCDLAYDDAELIVANADGSAAICAECVALCAEIIAEQRAEDDPPAGA